MITYVLGVEVARYLLAYGGNVNIAHALEVQVGM